jgi:hypothetical protein
MRQNVAKKEATMRIIATLAALLLAVAVYKIGDQGVTAPVLTKRGFVSRRPTEMDYLCASRDHKHQKTWLRGL